MGKDIHDNFQSARLIFEEASDILSMDVKKLAFHGPESELNKTEQTQPVLLTVSASIYAVLEDTGFLSSHEPAAAAGHSLGEYAALKAAESFSLAQTVSLVRTRGALMQRAVPEGVGAMAAVLGVDRETIDAVTSDVSRDDSIVVGANYNSPGQIVISGHKDAVERAGAMLEEAGAKKVIILAVSVPSHSPLMAEASQNLDAEIQALGPESPKAPKFPVISNVTADDHPDDTGGIRKLLTDQLIRPVLWEDSIRRLIDREITTFVEVGPKNVLTGLIRRIDRKVSCEAVGDMETLKALEKKFG
ncbi:MAG: ACP S-malonyltransferase [Deltaproteobacteria bacterium]|nr:ACP S-malonyltransferase [Candidatus Zymogenaceae bacterium]